MNGRNLVLDTNVIIYYFQGNSIAYDLIENNNIFVSVITEMELLSHSSLTKKDIENISDLLSIFKIQNISDDIKEKAIQLRVDNKLKLPDAIIAATAISLDIALISSDKKILLIDELNGIEFV